MRAGQHEVPGDESSCSVLDTSPGTHAYNRADMSVRQVFHLFGMDPIDFFSANAADFVIDAAVLDSGLVLDSTTGYHTFF